MLPLSVLIVEDNVDGAETLATVLDIYGHSVRIAGDGETALQVASEFAPDAVILDIGLPGKDGFTVAQELIARLGRKPLLIAMSGYTNMAARCEAAGFDYYYIKPVPPSVIDALLRLYSETPKVSA